MILFRSPKPFILAASILLGLAATGSKSLSEDFSYQNDPTIGSNVYALDNLADQMTFRYEWELRYNRSSRDSLILLRHIQNHAKLTNELIRAYRGKAPEAFQKAVAEVTDSVQLMDDLRKRARVSDGVVRMIHESTPLAEELRGVLKNSPKSQSQTRSFLTAGNPPDYNRRNN
ncbi:MAG: hypothetical protein P1U89_07575 [Verrucomicrobiales bacterium]|nr:hypothetical protein [Verrucomicrobiales bacterium]